MSLASPLVQDGNLTRTASAGDVLNVGEFVQDINNAAGVTWTAQQMISGLIGRRGAAGVTDTTADAASIVNALLPNAGYVGGGATTSAGIQPGASFRLRVASSNSGVLTIAAGANVSLVSSFGSGINVASGSNKDYLVTVLNGTPTAIIGNCSTTNGSAVVTGMTAAQTSQVTPGMAVSGTGIPGSTTVLSVQPGVGVTLSANATATTNPVALTFAPRVQLTGI
jgi:hypothetical protein